MTFKNTTLQEKQAQLQILQQKQRNLEQKSFLYQKQNKMEFFNGSIVNGKSYGPNPPQARLLKAWNSPLFKTFVFSGGNRMGKLQNYSAEIQTPSGVKHMGNLKVGDAIFGSDGKPCRVAEIFEHGLKDMYELTFDDGAKTQCGLAHLWKVKTPYNRFSKVNGRGNINKTYQQWSVVTLEELLKKQDKFSSPKQRYTIPTCQPVEYADPTELFVHPYLLGALIGDGCLSRDTKLTSADQEILDKISSILPENHQIKWRSKYDYGIIYINRKKTKSNLVTNAIRDLKLNVKSKAKFIPDSYKYQTVENRIELLRGLMDTDGYIARDCVTMEYYTISEKLAKDVQWLVHSLGGKAKISFKENDFQGCYTVRLKLKAINPFYLPRKANLWHPTNLTDERILLKIEKVGRENSRCIRVTSPDNTYLTDYFIVTHNTYIGAIIALSTLFGEWLWNGQPLAFPHGDPRKVRYIGQDWEKHIKHVVEPALRELWPKKRPLETKKNSLGITAEWLDVLTGSTLEIASCKQDPRLHEGNFVDLDVYDEPPPREIYIANARGLVDRQGKELFSCTLLNEAWIHQEIIKKRLEDGRPDPSVFSVTGEIYDNVGYGLTKEGIDSFANKLTDNEKEARLRGKPSYLAGLVLKEFTREIHIKNRFKVPLDWIVDIAIDIHPAKKQAILFIATSPKNEKYIIEEIWQHAGGKEVGELIMRKILQNNYRVGRIIIDPLAKGDGNNENTTYEKIEQVLYLYNYMLETASKDKEGGILELHDLLLGPNKEPSLFVFEDCVQTIKEMESWMYEKDTQKPQKVMDDMVEDLYRLALLDTQYFEPEYEEDEDDKRDRLMRERNSGANSTTGY